MRVIHHIYAAFDMASSDRIPVSHDHGIRRRAGNSARTATAVCTDNFNKTKIMSYLYSMRLDTIHKLAYHSWSYQKFLHHTT